MTGWEWTSAKRSGPIDVCQGDLVELRLSTSGNTERPENGYPPHLVFVPAFGQRARDKLGGTPPTRTAPVEFRLDLAPFWAPYDGQLYLDGGHGVTYTVTHTRAKCQPPLRADCTITLREIGVVPIQIPRGVYAISVPSDSDVVIAQGGDSLTLSLVAAWKQPLGHLAQGTIAASVGTLDMVTCYVRL